MTSNHERVHSSTVAGTSWRRKILCNQKERKNQVVVSTAQQYTSPSKGMSIDNSTGIQTRAMTEAQCIEGEANRELANNQGQTQGSPNPAMNPTVDLHKAKEEAIKEFVRRQGTIALDWYVPNFATLE